MPDAAGRWEVRPTVAVPEPPPREGERTVSIRLTGHVQGVGFRPYLYRLTQEYGIVGSVHNRSGGVDVLVQGSPDAVHVFLDELVVRAPPLSRPRIVERRDLPRVDADEFRIIDSRASEGAQVYVPADSFLCDDCRREMCDPADRRYGYPFINCTQCGPRYTLIESMPYDRVNTSMADFPLCAACEREYRQPLDRRFHAEPVACSECGPRLEFSDARTAHDADPITATVDRLREGAVVAVKGIGGYHLLCDATDADAVARLRRRKRRPEKPLAVMFPLTGRDGLDSVRRFAAPDELEAAALRSPQRPIVLVTALVPSSLAPNIAPDLTEIGAFLPYSPLHQLLLDRFAGPLVATSGNVSGEPVITDNADASHRLGPIADAFLHHDRRIVRPADDSVCRRIRGRLRPLRIGRGAAPVELVSPLTSPVPTLALGGQMKAAIALAWDDRVVVSPHIGEMDTRRSVDVFEHLVTDLQRLYGVRAERLVCDAHRGYTTHRWARRQRKLAVETVWHHEAHASALAAEAGLDRDALVFTWDGVGLGRDGTLWGGEALLGAPGRWRRVATFRKLSPPGGDRAGREPWRSAAAMCWATGRPLPSAPAAVSIAQRAWRRQLNCPATSAVGRLFDGAATLVLGVTEASYEAAGPMRLEALCRERREPVPLPVGNHDGVWVSDWRVLVPMLVDGSQSRRQRAERFHASIARAVLDQAIAVRRAHAFSDVGLTGGVFQNRFLTEQAAELLEGAGFRVHLPLQLPCNDGGLCFGQAVEAAAATRVS